MTKTERLARLQNDPEFLVNQILNNNPTAVAQKAIAEGLFTYQASPEELAQAIEDLLRQGNIESIVRILNVPFIQSGNETDLNVDIFGGFDTRGRRAVNAAKTADGASNENKAEVNWLQVGLGAITGALTQWMQQSGGTAAPGAATNQNPAPGASNLTPAQGGVNLVTVGLVFFGVVILGVATYFIVKAVKS